MSGHADERGLSLQEYVTRLDAAVGGDLAAATAKAMTVLVLAVYWAVPMSPPRFALRGAVAVVASAWGRLLAGRRQR